MFSRKSAATSDAKREERGVDADEALKGFLAKDSRATYTFDSERGAPESELCRAQDGDRRAECMKIRMQSTRLFQAMQDRDNMRTMEQHDGRCFDFHPDDPDDTAGKLTHAPGDNGFFCALPIDPSKTYIECTPTMPVAKQS